MESIDQFAFWNNTIGILTFNVLPETASGLYRSIVTLNDGRLKTEYILNVYITVPLIEDDFEPEQEKEEEIEE